MLEKFRDSIVIVVIIFGAVLGIILAVNLEINRDEDKADKNLTMSIGEKYTYLTEETCISKNKSTFKEEKEANIELIDEYNNVSILNIYGNYKNIKLKIPNRTNIFFILNNNISYEKINDNEYIINTTKGYKGYKHIKIIVDSKIFNNTMKFDEEYDFEYLYKENLEPELKEEYIFKKIIQVVSIFTIINIIIICIITKEKKVNKIYHRDTDDVVDIIFAENMIDKKMNLSNLIMATIVQQIVKGNIIYENDTLILKQYDKNSEIKDNIIKMFFNLNANKVIKVKRLFSVFEDKENVEKNVKKMKEIKKEINKLYYKNNIYNIKIKTLLNRMKQLSMILIYIIFMDLIYKIFGFVFVQVVFVLSGAVCLFLHLNKKHGIGLVSDIAKIIAIIMMPLLLAILLGCIFTIDYSNTIFTYIRLIELIVILIIAFINYIAIKKTKTHIFTKYGLEEYKKIKGLKDYIEDYSLMKERDMDAVIIWDDYLTYATAFGIPNKVTEKFSESLMNVAETIDRINMTILGYDADK